MISKKQTLIGLAVLSACGASMAQSSATLFGVVDLAYESVKTNAGSISGLSPSGNSASRLGFRGVEDLGGGLAASFWLEAALNPSSGIGSSGTTSTNQTNNYAAGGLTFNRRSTVSLLGSFGEVRLGRDTTPSWQNYLNADPFGAAGVGTILPIYTGNAGTNTFVRASNSIGYFLPAQLGGVYGQAMAAFGNQPNNATTNGVNTSDNGRFASGRLGYAQGPLDVAVAYSQTSFAALTQSPGSNGLFGTGSTGASQPPAGKFTDTSLAGSYKFGDVKVMGLLAQQKLSDVVTAGNNQTTKTWSLGLNAPVGPANLLAALGQATLGSEKTQKLSLGVVYNLSKRTALYATFAHVNNSGGASITAASYSSGSLGAVGGAANANGSSNGYDFGMRFSF
ncbi:MAG: porin [Curvibacter sp.]|nr:porin [Curvibacter sp.]